MDDLRYQVELLSALNNKLTMRDKMFDFIFHTSANAFLYHDFEENNIQCIGNWEQFFDFTFHSVSDYQKILESVNEDDTQNLKEVLFLEKTQREKQSFVFRTSEKRRWYECETSVSYNEFGQPLKKVIRFTDVSKSKVQNDELAYMAYYDMLTGLYTRNYFVRILGEWLRKAQDEKMS